MSLLRQQYLDYFEEVVDYGDGERPRVRHPMKWSKIHSVSKSGSFIDLQNADKKIWIWSDHHFSHRRIIEMERRPFGCNGEMHQAFINHYNETVSEGDIVIWAGDVMFGATGEFNDGLWKNFDKTYNILVVGNHDFKKRDLRKLQFDEQHLLIEVVIDGHRVVITHYPFTPKDKSIKVVHGHTHSRDTGWDTHYNVAVEALGYKPVGLKELLSAR